MKWKYRIAQKGDLYAAQCKAGWIGGWVSCIFDDKETACRIVARWKERELLDSTNRIYHKPEDICVKCKESE